MIYLVGGKEIDIPVEKPPYGQGSEGKVYRKGKYTYKIYFPQMLKEYGNKEDFHNYLIQIPTKQIILPDQAIYSEEGNYQGYRAPLISGAKRKQNGMIKLPSRVLIKNLQILEEDFQTLSSHHVLTADVTPINYIFNKNDNTMNVIDPGRYRHHCLPSIEEYQKQNRSNYESLIELLLYLDLIEYKPINSKRKLQELKNYLVELKRKEDCSYREFFQEKLQNFETPEEYIKSLKRYIR